MQGGCHCYVQLLWKLSLLLKLRCGFNPLVNTINDGTERNFFVNKTNSSRFVHATLPPEFRIFPLSQFALMIFQVHSVNKKLDTSFFSNLFNARHWKTAVLLHSLPSCNSSLPKLFNARHMPLTQVKESKCGRISLPKIPEKWILWSRKENRATENFWCQNGTETDSWSPKQRQDQWWKDQGDVELLLCNKRSICKNYPSCSTQVRHQRYQLQKLGSSKRQELVIFYVFRTTTRNKHAYKPPRV